VNLVNGTAVVVVPVSTAGEVQVGFTNVTVVTTLKVCKYLTASSGALAGQTFTFTLTDDAGTQTVQVVAQAGASGACKVVPVQVPVGSTVTTVETSMPYVGVNGGPAGAGGTVVTTVVSGINNIAFVNQAFGQLEICKSLATIAGDPSYAGTVFHFAVDGGPTVVPVAAGHCSPPLLVPAGTHTVKEVAIPYGFQFVSSTATGPLGGNRVTVPGNPVTVTVPYFLATGGGMTEVTFVDMVQRVSLKICKLIEPGSTTPLGNLPFTFNYTEVINGVHMAGGSTVPGYGVATVGPPYPGAYSCTGLLDSVPVINSDGTPISIGTDELALGSSQVWSVVVSNGTIVSGPVDQPGYLGIVYFHPGPGVVVVTYTNASIPLVR
jgi:hypothetical protein